MNECENHFSFEFADAVIIRESAGNITIGNVSSAEDGEEPEVSTRIDGDNLALDFVLPSAKDGISPTVSVSKDGKVSTIIITDAEGEKTIILNDGEDGEGTVTIDTELSDNSENPVQNKAVKAYIDGRTLKKVSIDDTSGSFTLNANTFYVFPEMTSLTVVLGTENSYGDEYTDEYRFRFKSGENATELILPSDVISDITVEANRIYEISIVDNYAVYTSWEV